ncbi:MAG: hypothetical protein KDB00_27035 [Planctomycetales bacterium]|nr:hypothetical protein [Planctomycetales bacterium]
MNLNRRDVLRFSAASIGGMSILPGARWASAADSLTASEAIQVLNPRGRVPLSFIIDDSTCLVNMGHFCMPQFAHAWPEREVYKQPWREWPREIPDSFVREFGEWCAEHGVKGKYSIVPYPACVGWLDRTLPGWSSQDLDNSLALVRDLMMPNWDIHPEMITHTRIIDLKTGRPMAEVNAGTMENSYPQTDISTDHLAAYLAYALTILKNCGLKCEGITTPGGFGNRVKDKLPVAVHQAVRDVFGSELPHFFKYVKNGSESTAPRLEFNGEKVAANLTMNVPAGTGDWFGSWEGSKQPEPDRYCNEDATSGRMVELIGRGEPAVMLCHWPGMYCNGTKIGFEAFQRVVRSLGSRFGDQTVWMKVSEIGRYWAAKELTSITRVNESTINMSAPLGCDGFTFSASVPNVTQQPFIEHNGNKTPLQSVPKISRLTSHSFAGADGKTIFCVDLPKGESTLSFG